MYVIDISAISFSKPCQECSSGGKTPLAFSVSKTASFALKKNFTQTGRFDQGLTGRFAITLQHFSAFFSTFLAMFDRAHSSQTLLIAELP